MTRTTVARTLTSGVRTVLSPTGLNVRADPSITARVVGTASWGTPLTVLGHTDAAGGWFRVRGANHTGWITANPRLSAPGEFLTYNSSLFNALYPASWTYHESAPGRVAFRPGTGTEAIDAATASAFSRLSSGHPGYGVNAATTVVVCGVTSDLVTYTSAGAATGTPTWLQVRLALDSTHALGLYASLTDPASQMQVFSNFVNSVTFPYRQCVG